ncbi:MAG TPA: EamA family transporter [Candidatus Rubrimentiphilum sp.]|nr:EamA family transporter [Candidatus Rubrimentiphilum sp.]
MATVGAIGNVTGEVFRKQMMLRYSATAVTFAYRTISTILIALVGWWFFTHGHPEHITNIGVFAAYILVLTAFLGYASWAHLKAFQLSAMSTTAPLLSFIPVFTLFVAWFTLHEVPMYTSLIGIILVVAGTFAIHVDLVSRGWLEPLKAVVKDPGSRYMMSVALLYGISGPIEKKIVLMSGPFTEGTWYAFGTALLFLIIALARKDNPLTPYVKAPLTTLWLSLSDSIVLVSQYAAYAVMPVVINAALRRTGTLIVVLLGWLVFKERGVGRKLLGSAIMAVGALIIYLKNLSIEQALVIAFVGLGILVPVAIRMRNVTPPPEEMAGA